MPFKSEKQKGYLWANHPEIARRWTKKYGSESVQNSPDGKNLPPWMNKGGKTGSNPKLDARKKIAAARLEKLKSGKK